MGLIRFLLAVSVVISHTHDPVLQRFLIEGGLAVKLFFVISGFYMALILNEKYVGLGSLKLFYQNRLLRLLPLYYLMLLMAVGVAFAGWAVRGFGFVPMPSHLWCDHWRNFDWRALAGLGAANLFVLGQEFSFWGAFLTPDGQFVFSDQIFGSDRVAGFQFLLNSPSWTLSMELGFYALAPFVVRRSFGAVVGWTVASLSLRLALDHFLPGGQMRWDHFLPTQLHFFLLGVIAYRGLCLLRERTQPARLRWGGRVAWVVLLVGIGGGALLRREWQAPFLAGLLAAGLPFIFLATERNSLDRFLGELSFPLYIAHNNVIASVLWIVQRVASLREEGHLRSFFFLASGVAFSVLLYWCVDRPIDRFRQRRIRAAASAPLT